MSAMRGRVRSRGTVLHGWVVAATALLLLLLQAPLALAQTVYFHNDVLGSPVVATDANGAVLWKQQYRPYGQPAGAVSGGVGESRLGFGGKPYEAGQQLSYFGARYYEPGSGRFIGIDPKEAEAGDLHSINRYAYANNNPYRYIDPDGAQAIPLVVMPGGGLGRLGGFAVAPPLQSLPGRSGAEARLYDLPGYQPAPGSEGSSSPGFTMLPPQGAVLLAFWALVQPAADFLSFAARGEVKPRNAPPAPLIEAEGRAHSIIEKPGREGQYTTHNANGTWKQYRGSGTDHGGVPRPNVKEAGTNRTPEGQVFIDRGRVRPARADEIPKN